MNSKQILKYDSKIELNYEEKINKDRFFKLQNILTDEKWEDTWVYDEELEKYKVEINELLLH